MKKYTIAIAGTTNRTQQCAQVLLESEFFEIVWILTPIAKPVGRKQIITPNPMEIFATKNQIPTVFVEKKLDSTVAETVKKLVTPDLLLVVDFGYFVPSWLLSLPKIAPLNIHPSELPRWRGSSPGQFALLFNEKKSAVTLMVMDEKLDHGAIIHQDFFAVDPSWNQTEYYAHAFNLICAHLDTKVAQFAQNPDLITPQPNKSPTPTAHLITKEQTYVPWNIVVLACAEKNSHKIELPTVKSSITKANLSPLLSQALKHNGSLALTLDRACKAFSPWPGLWTVIATPQGEKRMKILETEIVANQLSTSKISKTSTGETAEEYILVLKTVQIEGKTPTSWENVKANLLSK